MLMKKEVIEDNENLKKEIKDLKKQLEEEKNAYNRMYNMYVEKDNIINKAKMYCEDVIQEHENGEYDVDTVWLAIKEHKENIKSVLNILNGDLENYWRSDKE